MRGEQLKIDPCIPRGWREYEIKYRYKTARYHIKVENPSGLSRSVATVEVDGVTQTSDEVVLTDDGAEHQVRIVLGEHVSVPEDAEDPKGEAQTEALKGQ